MVADRDEFVMRRPLHQFDGGVVGKLMVVTVTTYSDDNGNSAMDASEARTTLTTKIAKLVSYVTKAGS